MDAVLQLTKITQSYGHYPVVNQLSLELERGEIGCLLGPSGCGKTTVMRTIAGFERLLQGEIRINGELVSSSQLLLPPEHRRVGMVFQDYALFPHLTLAANVAFGLKGWESRERDRRVAEVLELVGLDHEATRYPHEISGGQQQRVALARALAPRPALLLMDEPFSNLDVTLRERLSTEVRDILREYRTTALFVTHNQSEAFAIADRVGVMHDGRLLQWDTPHAIYHQPASPFVATFVGEGTLIPGRTLEGGRVDSGLGELSGVMVRPVPPDHAVDLLIRPEDIIHDDASPCKAQVVARTFRGANILYQLRLDDGSRVQALVPSHCLHQPGELIGIRSDVRHLVAFVTD